MTIFGKCALITLVIRNKQEAISSNYGYKKLIAWQKADELARKIYFVTHTFPKSELFGLTSQLRRASLSVPLNIIEGYGRNNRNEFRHFLSITLGSLAETEYLLTFVHQQKFLKDINYKSLIALKEECGRLIWRLYQSQK